MYPCKLNKKNFDISDYDEIWYIEVISNAKHESDLTFLITIISNLISPLSNKNNRYNHYLT